MDVAYFQLDLRAIETIALAPFAGALLRGGFGVAFKGVSCPLRRQPCETWLLAP